MFDRIERISIELTKFCNFNCSYCHQNHSDKVISDDMLCDVINFINSSSNISKGAIDITPSGGEVTCHEGELMNFFIRIKKEVVAESIRFALLSNMSNAKMVLDLLRDGTLGRERVGFSWDGKYNCDTRVNEFDNAFFIDQIKMIGSSEFSKDINIQHAITRKTLPHLFDNIKFLVDCGIRNINIYLINGDTYSDEDASEYSKQLGLISDLFIDSYINDVERIRLYIFNKCFRDAVFRGKESQEEVGRCRKIGNALHVTLDGGLYPCIYFGDHDILKLGDIKTGIDPKMIEKFHSEYTSPVQCLKDKDCKNRHCLSCPAANYRIRGSFNNRDLEHCKMYDVERYWFGFIMNELGGGITDLSLKNYWGRVNEPT